MSAGNYKAKQTNNSKQSPQSKVAEDSKMASEDGETIAAKSQQLLHKFWPSSEHPTPVLCVNVVYENTK